MARVFFTPLATAWALLAFVLLMENAQCFSFSVRPSPLSLFRPRVRPNSRGHWSSFPLTTPMKMKMKMKMTSMSSDGECQCGTNCLISQDDSKQPSPTASAEFIAELSKDVKLSRLDEGIKVVLDRYDSTLQDIFDEFRKERRYLLEDLHYTLDKLNYKGQVVCRQDRLDNRVHFNIKLSIDGCLYSSDVAKMNIKGHNKLMLNGGELDLFPTARSFAACVLGAEVSPKAKLFFNAEQSRVDLKFLNESSKETLTFTFEPGYPENDYEDLWIDVDA